jgi:putative tricarboxylic transport membrane protein
MWEAILQVLPYVFSVRGIAMMILGTAIGIVVGVLPGFSAAMGLALAVPITFVMSPEIGLLVLAGIYNGAIYGGSIAAILVNIPGTPAAIATSLDGYQMTKKGQANVALEAGLSASVFGGIVSALALLFIAPLLARVSLSIGPPEVFWLAMFGMTVVVSLETGSVVKGLIAGALGLFASTIGLDPVTARPRFVFGITGLLGGVDPVCAVIGLFSIPQAIRLAERRTENISAEIVRTGEEVKVKPFHLFPKYWRTYVRSSILGTIIGIIPAAGTDIAALIGYNEARRNSKEANQFGKGHPEGVRGAEAANNAVTGGSMVPALTLGIPGNSCAAVILGGLMIHGLTVGPQLFQNNPHAVYAFMLGMLVTNIIMFFLGHYGARRVFVNVVKVPNNILGPVVVVLSVIGSFAIRNSISDVIIMLAFGVIGYVMEKYGYPTAPVVLTLILGPLAEANLFRTISMGGGSIRPLFTRPISIAFMLITIVSLVASLIRDFRLGGKVKNEKPAAC